MKKLLAVLLTMLLGLAVSCAWAEEDEPTVYGSGKWRYVLLEDGTAEISGNISPGKDLTIPTTIDGYTVTAIRDIAISGRFSRYLTSVTIPDSVTTVGGNPFTDCPNLTDIIVSPDHPTLATIDGVLFDKTEKKLISYPCAFTNTSYVIPQGIRIIGNDAFYDCDSLTSVTIPDSVTTIGEDAFYSCNSLTSITIQDSVTTIRENPFTYCKNLTDIIVSPDHPTLATIDGVLFDKVEKKLLCYPCALISTSYVIPQGIRIIGDDAFYACNSLTSVTIPDSVTTIGDYAFYSCDSLASITIPGSVTTIGNSTFRHCDSLTSVTIPDSVTTIGDSAFFSCDSLTSVTIPDSVTTIGDDAFNYCESLTSVTIPNSVTTIGDDAFSNCESLTNLTVFRGSYAEEWVLAHGYTCTYIKPTGLSCGDLTYRIQEDGTAIIIGCTTEATKLEVPAAIESAPVTSIGAYAFENCTTLTAVTLPDSITSIADTAFYGCGSITFTVPRNSYAAQYCKTNGLRYTYPDSLDWLNN